MRYKEKTGRWPLSKAKTTDAVSSPSYGDNVTPGDVSEEAGVISQEKEAIAGVVVVQ
jgi:hypothetical protein